MVGGWSRVATPDELSGPIDTVGVIGMMFVGRRGDGSCLEEMDFDRRFACVAWLPSQHVMAFDTAAEWSLLASSRPAATPQLYSADTQLPVRWALELHDPPATARRLAADGTMDDAVKVQSVAIDDDGVFPIAAGTTTTAGGDRLGVWTLQADHLVKVAPPDGQGCCVVEPGSVVRSAGTDPQVLVAASVRDATDSDGPYRVRAWAGWSDGTGPDSWTWAEQRLATSLEVLTDAVGDTLDTWLAGTSHGTAVVLRTSEHRRGFERVELPDIPVDPDEPVLVVALSSFADDDALVLAVQTPTGGQVWTHHDSGWRSVDLPKGVVVDAAVFDGTAYVTLRDDSGHITLWRQRVMASTIVEDLGGPDEIGDYVPRGYLDEVRREDWHD